MSELFWRKMKTGEIDAVKSLFRANENECAGACGRFLTRDASKDPVWLLRGKNGELLSIIVNSKSTLMPVLCGKKEIPALSFLDGFLRRKKIHSTQGLLEDVLVMQDALQKTGREIIDLYDYDLMSLDKKPNPKGFSLGPSNLVLRVPKMTDLEAMTALQAAYEKEEVLPKGSVSNVAVSRMNAANLIRGEQVLAAQLNGRLIGKINVSAVSFTRYQVGGVFVHPDFRAQGIARRMATEFIAKLIGEGRGVTLFVKKNNTAAQRLYDGMGFTIRGDYRITYY